MELISVIVPVYKVEKYLPECIDSILAQTYGNFELILIDDGSPDNCGKICDEYAKKDPRIKVFHKENGGVSSARNVGLDNANGEYITFVDSDDTIDKQYLELLYSKILEDNFDMCISNSKHELQFLGMKNILIKFLSGKIYQASYGILFKRSLMHGVRFDKRLKNNEDFLFTLRCILNCKKISSIPIRIYYYRKNETSVTQNYIKGLLANNLIVYNELYELYESNNISKKCLRIYACRSSYFLLKNELKYKNSDYKERIKEIKHSIFYKNFKLTNIFVSFRRFLSKLKVLAFLIRIKLCLY